MGMLSNQTTYYFNLLGSSNETLSDKMEGKPAVFTNPPPQYGGPHPQQVIIHSGPMVLGPESQSVTCPSCHAQVRTTVQVESSTKTHLIALVLCLVCFPCVCVPYCVDSCKSKKHYCPQCSAYLGQYDN